MFRATFRVGEDSARDGYDCDECGCRASRCRVSSRLAAQLNQTLAGGGGGGRINDGREGSACGVVRRDSEASRARQSFGGARGG